MVILIDAFNVIYKFPDLEEEMARGHLERAMTGLLQVLLDFQDSWEKPLKFYVFFDGKRKKGDETRQTSISGIQCYYSHDLSADALIQEFIKSAKNPGEIRAVSSDKAIMQFARKHKVHIQSSEDFASWVHQVLNRVGEKPEKDLDPELTDKDIEYWAELFRKKNVSSISKQ